MGKVPAPIRWTHGELLLLDQRRLPYEESIVSCRSIESVHDAIRDMVVRGAPCIGYTAIYGLALWVHGQVQFSFPQFKRAGEYLKGARPTAVNLMFEVDRIVNLVKERFSEGALLEEVYDFVVNDGNLQMETSEKLNGRMAQFAMEDLSERYGDRRLVLMTHCNTGFLACGTLGTALGVISYAHSLKRVTKVFVDETRPYMQGTRLTAYELSKERIDHEIVVEGAASYVLSKHKIDAIFVGADRIAANGDTANKIGTATLAIVANYYRVPFYVVAPLSSFDFTLPDGQGIEIEMRSEDEILSYGGKRVAPTESRSLNPSFDVTPASLITGIICEGGLIKNPTTEKLAFLKEMKR